VNSIHFCWWVRDASLPPSLAVLAANANAEFRQHFFLCALSLREPIENTTALFFYLFFSF